MPVRIEPHAEPIPGYRLIERLGVGGFGEVWKCEAPGGLFKAIKVVHGELGGTDDAAVTDEDSRADQELKALKRVKTVHHPYILSLERFDIVDGQLMIVMELADRTLWDRFKECRNQGLPGIPRQELLGYMRETAEALDLMNDQFQLQHLDIKPQNLFLVFNHVKVADFGLVKDLGTKATATITGGVTPVYAAPETFDGWLSRFSDQYSLAIVYQELLTGQRPFVGATMRQLVLQHLQGSPDVASLPAADRPIVSRALAKDPEARYPNCLELIEDLIKATPTLEPLTTLAAAPEEPEPTAGVQTRDARGNGLGARLAAESVREPNGGRPQVLPPRPDRSYTLVEANPPAAAGDETPPFTAARCTVPAIRRTGAGEEATFTAGIVQPALVVGLGGIGVRMLGQFRQRLTQELAQPDELPQVRLLAVDADPEALQAANAGDAGSSLKSSEILPTRLYRPSHYLKSGGSNPLTDSWLNPKLLYRIPRDQNAAGLRPLGRLAFVDNYTKIVRRVEAAVVACGQAPQEPPAREELAPRSLTPRVYITACLAGNTGSGMFLDMAYAARAVLRRLGHHHAEIVGLFFLPAADAPSKTALSNAHAALTELSYFSGHPFTARYDSGETGAKPINVTDPAAPFDRCVLFALPRQSGAGAEAATAMAVAVAGDYLYREVATPLGKGADEKRGRCLRHAGPALPPGLDFHVANLSRLIWPRQALLEKAARRLGRRLVDAWMSKDARPIADAMGQWADEKWDVLGLRPESLITRVHERCAKVLKQAPEKLVNAVTGPLAEALTPPPNRPDAAPALGPAVAALAELDRLLGVAEECRPTNQPPAAAGVLETAVAEAAARLADLSEQRLAEHVVKLIEDPNYRLAGAEEALRRLSAAAERALASQETLARELNDSAALFYQRAQKLLEMPVSPTASTNATAWRLAFTRRTPTAPHGGKPAELLAAIRQYAKARYHGLVLQHVNRLYVALRGQLNDQLREIGFCRQRLSELAHLLQPVAAANGPEVPSRMLLPTGCQTLDDALEQMEQRLTREDLVAFDEQMQTLIRGNYQALVNVCMGSSAMVRTLAPAMVARAREFLEPRLDGTSVAELLLNRLGPDDGQRADYAAGELQGLYKHAMPKTGDTRPDVQLALALLPDDLRGMELQQLLRDGLPEVGIVGTNRADEIVFYREHIYRSAAGADQLGPAAHDAYRHRLAADPVSVHTREDIPEWQPVAVAVR